MAYIHRHIDTCIFLSPRTTSSPLAAGQLSCTSGEISCEDGTCIRARQLCDGVWDCPEGADEGPGHCPLPSLPTPPAGTWQSPSTSSLNTASSPMGSASPGESLGINKVRKLEACAAQKGMGEYTGGKRLCQTLELEALE